MSTFTAMVILLSIGCLLALGFLHYWGLVAIRRVSLPLDNNPMLSTMGSFAGLIVLHTLEIFLFAALYRALVDTGMMEGFINGSPQDWEAYMHFSGMSFVTLGYSQLEASGDLRLLSMMQSLGGFMVLTWSATFMYEVSRASWRRDG